ncbi:cold shock protein (beta-ribbon, CspA family) [Pseudomonas flavescens]|uniref:Cold shock protein (Beta-ribbon, CspA family) n=1 Tax=Phytopseudomonas flavescens TaxID=29435 RepID=A0A1G8JCU9_9GAMM|nr:cold shock protein (beta-ribbon, CspA family) [Pseudomonas flavescens]
MLKIVHLLVGLSALLLSTTPSLSNHSQPFLQHPDALCLALFGFLNLLLATQFPIWHNNLRQQLQNLVCALLILGTLLQALILLAPLPFIAEQPALLFSLLITAMAVALHLATNLRFDRQKASVPQDLGDRETGTVKWFNTSKGFGFISRDAGEDIFVHFRAIRGEGHRVLVEGQRVEFSVMQRDKGLQAEDVIAALPTRR